MYNWFPRLFKFAYFSIVACFFCLWAKESSPSPASVFNSSESAAGAARLDEEFDGAAEDDDDDIPIVELETEPILVVEASANTFVALVELPFTFLAARLDDKNELEIADVESVDTDVDTIGASARCPP